MKNYRRFFYEERHQETVYAARTILPMVAEMLPNIESAVDLGCGVGTWLSVLKEMGLADILGIDGPWVPLDLLEIPHGQFRQADLRKTIVLDRKFDLALSLEVAEHLPPQAADPFVHSLANLSDFILFSAAIPFQGGRGHVNAQWPVYWANLFGERGYVPLDFIRREIWDDDKIPTWYRQNILAFVKRDRMKDLKMPKSEAICRSSGLSLVHPDCYLSKANRVAAAIKELGKVRQIIGKWTKRKFSARGSRCNQQLRKPR